ncbi:MAG: recombinase RecA [bacterium]
MNEDKKAALQAALKMIEKQYGAGAVMVMGEKAHVPVEMVSSGSLKLDEALGGGYPKGRIIEIFGPESSGKTTLALHAIAEVQKAGGTAAFIDAEHALDPQYAAKLGVDIKALIISQPDYGEQALEIVDALIHSNAVDIIVIDSVAALTPKAELEGSMGDSHMGLQARLMSQALRKITGAISKSGCTLIAINQLRMKIGVMFGNPETTTGGNSLKFYASQRIDIRKRASIEEGTGDDKKILGNIARVKVVKNKIAPPFREAEIEIMYNEGISKLGEIIDLAVEKGLIKKSGAFYTHGETKLGQGRDNVKQYLRDNPKLMTELEKEIRKPVIETKVAKSEKEGK